MFPDGRILPLETRNTLPAKLRVTGTRRKTFASVSLEVILRGDAPSSILYLNSPTHEYWKRDKQHHMLDADSKYAPHLKRNGLSSTKYCHLVFIIAESSKDHSTIVSSH